MSNCCLIWLFRPLLAVAVLMRSERRGDVENTVRSVYKGMEIASRFEGQICSRLPLRVTYAL